MLLKRSYAWENLKDEIFNINYLVKSHAVAYESWLTKNKVY